MKNAKLGHMAGTHACLIAVCIVNHQKMVKSAVQKTLGSVMRAHAFLGIMTNYATQNAVRTVAQMNLMLHIVHLLMENALWVAEPDFMERYVQMHVAVNAKTEIVLIFITRALKDALMSSGEELVIFHVTLVVRTNLAMMIQVTAPTVVL